MSYRLFFDGDSKIGERLFIKRSTLIFSQYRHFTLNTMKRRRSSIDECTKRMKFTLAAAAAAVDPPSGQLFIKTPVHGFIPAINLANFDVPVKHLMDLIYKRTGWPSNEQLLYLGPRFLYPGENVWRDYHILPNTVIRLAHNYH